MKPTPESTRAAIDSAAASLGWTATTPPTLNKEDPPRPLPATVTDPATGRRLHLHRVTYPASQAGRLQIFAAWPQDARGKTHTPRDTPSPATIAGDTAPAAIARRLARYMNETADAHHKAAGYAAQHDEHEAKTAATVAALVAAGWRPPTKHDSSPRFPLFPGDLYGYAEHVSGDRIRLELRNLSTAQALAVTAALVATP